MARGSMVTVALLLLMESRGVGTRNTGAASGMFFSIAEMGGVLGPLSVGVLHDASGGFSGALYLLTGVCSVLLGLLWLLRRAEV
jgi:cyanate permease